MGLCGALAGLGLMLWAVSLLGLSPNASSPETAAVQNITVKVTGQACLQDSRSLEGLKVMLHLPQVPLDVEQELTKVATSERGDFVLETTFQSDDAPTWCTVSARCRGYAEKTTRELTLGGSLEAQAPPLVLKRQPPSLSR